MKCRLPVVLAHVLVTVNLSTYIPFVALRTPDNLVYGSITESVLSFGLWIMKLLRNCTRSPVFLGMLSSVDCIELSVDVEEG